MQQCSISEHNAGRRVDVLVRALLPEVSLGIIMKWIRTGRVRVNDKKIKPNTRVLEHDVLNYPGVESARVPVSTPASFGSPTLAAACQDMIVYEDND